MEKKILVVDDEQDIVDLISYNLSKEGYKVFTASNGTQAVEVATTVRPDLVILDIMMPGMDGFEVCRSLRQDTSLSTTAIMFLTAKSSEIDQILGLELGADDYIQKPISPRVLLARVKTIIRRGQEKIRTETIAAPEILRLGALEVNRQNYTVRVDGKEIFFPKKEFELLAFLASNRGKVFSREALLRRIWGESVYVIDRTVDVHVSKVREKLGTYGAWIETVKGVGYRFSEQV
ncbi:MAG: response regulator transcription factor [Ignavibacteria bacterium]|nr:response regulator transcription factor [Ignavibacteria bacterium]MBP6509427.1 response regulator transcription factor [Candidatus Kapabacteria bacterium]MBK6420100.1 response regulator transcription factor [Ignavibacteria bacterium]MBK6759264.1 response regulator transcription factor [Ignavibacteria bacterium]MBK7034291.1 response regulator transcription factor [Ignavibacteria bacterium]